MAKENSRDRFYSEVVRFKNAAEAMGRELRATKLPAGVLVGNTTKTHNSIALIERAVKVAHKLEEAFEDDPTLDMFD